MKLNKSIGTNLLIALFAVGLTLFTFRPIFSGQLIGDPFDSRLMIVIHEHWWSWLRGLSDFRDLGFFYPYNTTLGFSDVFLIPGLIYSIFRSLGYGLAESWTFSTFIIIIIGNLGWTLIARTFLRNIFIKILFVSTIILSFSFTAYFVINPNIVGYSLLSWFGLLLYSIEKEQNELSKQRKIAIFIILFQIYALSYWYGAFFLIFLVFIRILLGLISSFKNFKLRYYFSYINKIDQIWVIAIPIILFFGWLFYYIYISIVSEPFRSKTEMIINSPSVNNLSNAGSPTQYGLTNSIFRDLYQYLGLNRVLESTIGLGIALTLVGVISMGLFILKGNRVVRLWTISLVLAYLYFVKIFNNMSIHGVLFDFLPGLNSIRYPGRYIVVLGFGLILISFKLFDNQLLVTKYQIVKYFYFLIGFILVLDQIRTPFIGWDAKLLTNKNLFSQAEKIKQNCDYFYFDHPGGWWHDQIEAITFSAQVGIPTVNGYSGAFPSNYPVQSWNSTNSSKQIFDWMSAIDSSKRGCFLSGISDSRSINKEKVFVDFIGFSPQENKGLNYWNWAVNKNPFLFIFNSEGRSINVTFEIETSPCSDNQLISIKNSNSGEIIETVQVRNQKKIAFELDFNDVYSKQIEFATDASVCKVKGDLRGLYFNVKNLTYQELT